jgi:hypothetical protein
MRLDDELEKSYRSGCRSKWQFAWCALDNIGRFGALYTSLVYERVQS